MSIMPRLATEESGEALEVSLFTRVRGIGILGSSLAGSWIKPRNTPPRWPWAGPNHARGGWYYWGLDAYANSWMLPARPFLVLEGCRQQAVGHACLFPPLVALTA